MSSANRIAGNRGDDAAARLRIRNNWDASAIRREFVWKTNACLDI